MNDPAATRRRLCDFLRRRSEDVLVAWERLVRADWAKLPRAQVLDRPRLRDSVPRLLERIALAVEREDAALATLGGLPEEHGLERFEVGWDVGEVVAEYRHLRTAILQLWREEVGASADAALDRLHQGIDDAVLSAVRGHTREALAVVREDAERGARKLEDLLTVAEATLETLDLDALLREVLERIRTAFAADNVAVLLVAPSGQEVVVRAAVGVCWEDEIGMRVPIGHGFAGRVFAANERFVIDDASTLDLAAPMRAKGVRAMMGAPLRARGERIGVLHLATLDPARRFGDEDADRLQLMADRVATAIQHARLFERAEQAVRSRDALLASISHDLRSPLNSIVLNARALERTLGAEPALRHRAEMIQRSCARAQRLIEDLLSAEAVESGRVELRPDRHPAAAVARDAVEMLEPAASEKGVLLTLHLPQDPGPVRCDRDQAVRALVNLVQNGVTFTPPGGKVRVTATAGPDEVTFTVQDTGPGVSDEERPHLFQRGFRGGRAGQAPGLGLGLAIARALTEAQGGRVWVDPGSPGAGCTVHLALPAARD